MSTTLPKTRNARAPRTKAKAAAPEKTALNLDAIAPKEVTDATAALVSQESAAYSARNLPPVHQRWSTMLNALIKGDEVELSTATSKEAWEWFRDKSSNPKVTMTNRSVGVIVAGKILFEHHGCLTAVLKGGRK